MDLTLQIHWGGRWRDAGTVRFREPDQGLTGSPTFFYSAEYAADALENTGDFERADLIDRTAVGVNLPCHFAGDYMDGEIVPVLRDIIPQGAGRRHWIQALGYGRDPEQAIDVQLLSEGCSNPIGNLRIKEAAEAFERQVAESEVVLFDRSDVCARTDDLVQYAHSLRVALGGATGAGGDAPKLLLVETLDGCYALEGTLPDDQVVNHWLVKFPRGRKSREDMDVLRGEAAIYSLLEQRNFTSISGSFLEESAGAIALWLPRFDRIVQPNGVIRHGVESIYSMMAKVGDGAQLEHPAVIRKLLTCATRPENTDAVLAHYLARDILNTAVGNRDNHGRNTALIKRGTDIELAPAFDIAPMVLDPEAIAMSTLWPGKFRDRQLNTDYAEILNELAHEPTQAARYLLTELRKLVDMRSGLATHGAPEAMLNHKAIRMHEPERVIQQITPLADPKA